MATWSGQLVQTLEGEQAIEGRYSDKAKERTFHHGPNCHRQFAWRPNICPQSVLDHTAETPLAAGMGPYMLPLKLRLTLYLGWGFFNDPFHDQRGRDRPT